MPTHVHPWCRHYPNNNWQVSHQCDAKIALIGEAPGRVEDETGKPFVGSSGYDLERWWGLCGLRRADFYIDNVFHERPPDNDLSRIPSDQLSLATERMLWRLKRLAQPIVIVPTGNTALRALLGDRRVKISDWRGSILSWNGVKVIPTIHPAATQRQRILTKLCVADWKRISYESSFPQLNLPQRKHIIDPSIKELEQYDRSIETYFNYDYRCDGQSPRVLSVDVENVVEGDRHLTCVGFSFEPSYSITISTLRSDYEDDRRFASGQSYIAKWLSSGYPLVGQNFVTDLYKLSLWNPILKGHLMKAYIWDLMEMAHLLDPNDGGGTEEGSEGELEDGGLRIGMLDLATLTSLWTRQPFYKYLSVAHRWEDRQRYNGLDACCQREVFDRLWEQLNERCLV